MQVHGERRLGETAKSQKKRKEKEEKRNRGFAGLSATAAPLPIDQFIHDYGRWTDMIQAHRSLFLALGP